MNKLIKISTPGKVILFGEHSVVYGKLAIAASLNLRTNIFFNLNNNDDDCDNIKIEFTNFKTTYEYNLSTIENDLLCKLEGDIDYRNPESINHIQLLNLIRNFLGGDNNENHLISFFYLFIGILNNYLIKPFTIKVETELSIGSGTGSSASYAVALSGCFLYYRKNFHKLNKDDLDLICKWSYFAEKIFHGTPSGIDNTICTYGGILAFKKNNMKKFLQINDNFKIFIINTNIKRNTKILSEKVANFHKEFPQLINKILDVMNEIALEALDCLENIKENDNFSRLLYLFGTNHKLLKCLDVSHDKLEEIIKILFKFGLIGKLTGAGGGGYAICLIPKHYTNINNVIIELNNFGFDGILTDLGGVGITIE